MIDPHHIGMDDVEVAVYCCGKCGGWIRSIDGETWEHEDEELNPKEDEE